MKELNENEEVKKGCESMQRAFFVLEASQQYNEEKKALETGYALHLVLVGGTPETHNMIKELTKELRADEGVVV